jgi:hypothetical protein
LLFFGCIVGLVAPKRWVGRFNTLFDYYGIIQDKRVGIIQVFASKTTDFALNQTNFLAVAYQKYSSDAKSITSGSLPTT